MLQSWSCLDPDASFGPAVQVARRERAKSQRSLLHNVSRASQPTIITITIDDLIITVITSSIIYVFVLYYCYYYYYY